MAAAAEAHVNRLLPPGIISPPSPALSLQPRQETIDFIASGLAESAGRSTERRSISPAFCSAFARALGDGEFAQPLSQIEDALVLIQATLTEAVPRNPFTVLHESNQNIHDFFQGLKTKSNEVVAQRGGGWKFEPTGEAPPFSLPPDTMCLPEGDHTPFIDATMHALDTPLTVIYGSSQLLMMTASDMQRPQLESILSSSQVIRERVEELGEAPGLGVNIAHDGTAHLFIPQPEAA